MMVAACGGGEDAFDAEVDRFAPTLCEASASCGGQDEMACLTDVYTDMAAARDELDEAGRARCIECMEAKRAEIEKLLAADCDTSVLDDGAVFAACDLDPAVDYDGDGEAANDDDEACAGYP